MSEKRRTGTTVGFEPATLKSDPCPGELGEGPELPGVLFLIVVLPLDLVPRTGGTPWPISSP